ncbi:hypothetical protein [Streptomyces angustmyceticus]|uniref:hypothetical protein n=1 Tax=Streptomyces angustmyceticus TaxID=285578 RepID=UPI003D8C1200
MLILRATWAVWCNRRVIRETPNSPTARVSAIAKAEEPMMARSRRRRALGPQPHRGGGGRRMAGAQRLAAVRAAAQQHGRARRRECEHIVRSPRGAKEW